MTDRITNSDLSTLDTAGESDLVQHGPAGERETIELTFTRLELDEFLRNPAMHGDLSHWLVHPVQPAVSSQSQAPTGEDYLLTTLGDDMPEIYGEGVLEAAMQFGKQMDSGNSRTFLLTEIEIGDLIGDCEQAWNATLGLELEFLDTFFTEPVTLNLGGCSSVIIEIEDEASLTAAHILS